ACLAEHARDDALGEHVALGVLDDLDDDLVAGLDVLGGGVADNDGLREFAPVGLHEPLLPLLEDVAGEGGALALEDLDDLADEALLVAATALARDEDAHAVAGEGAAGRVRGDEDVALAVLVVGADEAEALGVALEDAGDLAAGG